jgi:hypothetical protein
MARLGIVSSDTFWRWVMPSKAEEYRAKAEECERLAESVREQTVKQHYFDLARQWRELAAAAERR